MPLYKYTARDKDGKRLSGTLEAQDEQAFFAAMRSRGLFTETHSEKGTFQRTKRLSAMQLSDFCRSTGTLLHAGVSLARALNITAQAEDLKPNAKAAYEKLLHDVREGVALSDAMDAQGNVFPELLCNMMRSAELSGNLDAVMLRMGTHFEKTYRINKKVSGAMTYPGLLFFLVIAVFVFIVTYVVPQFMPIFSRMESLPATTQFLLDLSETIKSSWLLILMVALVMIVAFLMLRRVPSVKFQLDKLKLHLPLVGKLLRVIYTARFARTLSSLYASGLPIIRALAIGGRTLGNTYIEKQFETVVNSVREGGQLSRALAQVDGFIRRLADSVQVGEETGNLDSMLLSMADSLEYESEMSVAKLIDMLQPAMIILIAVVIGFVLVSVMLPIFQYYSSIETMSYT